MDSAAQVGYATEIVSGAAERGVAVRVIGGVAVAIRCPSARVAPLARSFSDIDLIVRDEGAPALADSLEEQGYQPEERFNALHGHRRLIFDHSSRGHLDIFVDEFVMCHRLDFSDRLDAHATTASLEDLVLTKLQVAELNAKDVTDVAALLVDHGPTDPEEPIDASYLADFLARDWGWWRTVTANLQALPRHLDGLVPAATAERAAAPVAQLAAAIEEKPKSLRWKARAKVGDRVPWRDEPEESR